MGKTGAERLRESLERKKQKKKERNARVYSNNKDRILAKGKEQRRLKRPRVAAEEDRDEGEARKPNWRLYKARQRARQRPKKKRHCPRVFPFLLPTQYDKHFLTEQRQNEPLTPQKPSSHVLQEKKVLSFLLSSKAPQRPQRGSHCNNVAM